MVKNTGLSSSEQYVKKSNRWLLVAGIVGAIAFLFALIMLTSGGTEVKKRDELIVPDTMDDLIKDTPVAFNFDESETAAGLKVFPERVDLTNIVVGSAAEAVVTVTAQKSPIRLEGIDLAEAQTDGFVIENGACQIGMVLAPDTSCNFKVKWNPVSLRSYSNYINVLWRKEDPTAALPGELKTTEIAIFGQSKDTENCVICEDKYAQDAADALAKKMGVLDEATGLYVKDGEIMGIVELDKIAISINGTLLGRVTKDTNEVVNDANEVIARVLGDDTVVSKELDVLGAALPLASVLDSSGQVIGRLIADGTVVDNSENLIGLPMADGSVIGLNGNIIGSVMPWSVVLNMSSKAVGGTQLDGTVLLADGQRMGRILPGGLVVNDQGAIVGGVVNKGLGIGQTCGTLGKVAQNGKIYNAFDQQVGYTTIDGLVLDMAGAPVGRVVREGLIVDLQGVVIGFVNSEGKAVSKKADLIGCVNPDGSVVAGKDVIGSVMHRGRVIGYDRTVQGIVLPNGVSVRPNGEVVGTVLASGYVIDLNEKTIGSVIPKGTAVAPGCVLLGILDLNGQVLNSQGIVVGVINPDKKVLNSAGEIIGGVTPLGVVTDLKGKFLGYVRPDGKVINKMGQVIGCVNPDGSVVDEKGNLIGIVSDATGAVLDANGNPTGWIVVGDKVYDENGNLVGILIGDKVVNERGEIVGFIPPDGIVVSPEGRFLGRFTSKVGYAVDAKGVKFARVLPDYTAVSTEKSEIIGALIPDGSQIINIDNEKIGSVNANGEVVDTALKVLGIIRADGSAIDNNGVVLGALMPTGSVLDWMGNVLGSVQPDGKVLSSAQKQIGVVRMNRTVVDAGNNVIGMVFPEASIPLGEDGKLLGLLTIDGGVNKDGKPIGRITAAGNVFSLNGQSIGSLVRLGSVLGTDKKVKGWIAFDGKLNSKEDFQAIGRVMPDGYVIDDNGMQIGHVIPRQTVADLKGNFGGLVSVDGRVLGRNGEDLGSFPYDNRLLNANDVWVGRVLPVGVALDVDGRLLGSTRYDAAVVNTRGQSVGQVRYDNRIVNTSGEVIGQYVPYGTLYFDQKGKVLGAMAFDGVVRDGKGSEIGLVVGTTLVDKNSNILGNEMGQGFALDEQGNVTGHIFPNATTQKDVDGEIQINTLTTNLRIVDRNKAIVGGTVPFGIALGLDLSVVGNIIPDGSILQGNALSAKSLTDTVMYDTLDKVVGGVITPAVVVGRDGRIVGSTSVSNAVNDNKDARIATLMPFGTALGKENNLVGMTMPTGAAVDDFARVVGFVAADGSVIKADGAMAGRVMQDGTIVRLLSRDAYGVMPDFADVIASGVAIALKPQLLGRSMPSGDVLDTTNKKIASVLDDATLLGTDGNLAGALVGWRTAIDHQTNVIGNSTGDGFVTSIKGVAVGPLASNGAIKGKHQLKTLGAVIPKELVAKQCKIQGQVRYDGRIIDGNAQVVGTIGLDGMAKGTQGQPLGGVVLKGTVIADNGDVLGRTLPDADVVNMDGVSIGCALEDGTVIDKNGNVIGHVLKRGIVVDENGNVIGRVLRNGQVVNAKNEVIGKVLGDGTVVDKDGNVIGRVVDVKRDHLLYDDDGNIIGSMDKAGRVFDNNGKHLFTVGADDKLYDPNGNLIGYLDEEGNIYDLAGNKIGDATNWPTYLYDANGNVLGYLKDGKLFDVNGNQTGWIDENGNIYDMDGNLIGRINPDGSLSLFGGKEACQNAKYNGEVRDVNGELLYTIKCGKIYDKYGNLIGTIDENGNMYDLNGNYMGRIDENGNVYDADGNLIGKFTPDLSSAECKNAKYNGEVHDVNGELLYRIECGKIYDKYGNLIGTIDENGNMYDLNGNYMGRIDENGNVYDADGNLIGKFTPDLSSTECKNAKYNGEVRDVNGELLYTIKCGKIYDKYGNLIGTIDENGNMYDLNGNYMGRIDENGNVYDADGNLIGKFTPDLSSAECKNAKYNGEVRDVNGELLYRIECGKIYDKYGNLIGTIDENGNMYDLNGNYMGRIDENGNVFDANGNLIGRFESDLASGECKNAQYNGEVYDTNGELLYRIECGKIYDKDGKLIGYIDDKGIMYDLNGNRIGYIDSNGNVYDADGNLIGRFKPASGTGYVSGGKNLLANAPVAGNAMNLAGRKIAIGNKTFRVLPDGSIVGDNGVVGWMKNGVPYGFDNRPLADSLAEAERIAAQPQVQNVFDPAQAAAMRDILARRRADMKNGVGQNMAKLTPDGRILARAKDKKSKDFGSKNLSSWPVDMTHMILKDKPIPAVLVRSIDSRYPSVPATAIVERNVYAEDGRNIVIPSGSKLIGRVSGSPGTNHVSKLEISWERLIRPDGSQFTLSATSGDAQGRGGVAAYLDEQWLARYGKPLLQSTVTSAISYLVASDETVTQNQNFGTSSQSDRARAAQDARENFIDNMEMIFQQMIEDSSVTPPVVFVPSGTRMTVFAMEDLWLRSEADDEDDYVAEFGADPKQVLGSGKSGMQKRPAGGSSEPASSGATGEDVLDDEEYYDPGYSDEEYEDDEEIYSPEVGGGEEESLEDKYRKKQGLSSQTGKTTFSKPLNSSGSSKRTSGSMF